MNPIRRPSATGTIPVYIRDNSCSACSVTTRGQAAPSTRRLALQEKAKTMGFVSFVCLWALAFSPLAARAAGLEENRRLLRDIPAPEDFEFISLNEDALPPPFTIDIGPCSVANDGPVFDPFTRAVIERPSPTQFQAVGDLCCGATDPQTLKNCKIETIIEGPQGTRIAESEAAHSYATWAGRRRMLNVESNGFVFATDVWYLGADIKNGFGCFCLDTVQGFPTSGSTTMSSAMATATAMATTGTGR